MDVEKIKAFKKNLKFFKRILKAHQASNPFSLKLSEDLQKELLDFFGNSPRNVQTPHPPQQILKKPKKVLIKSHYFPAIFTHIRDFLPLKELLAIRQTNQHFFSLIRDYLLAERLSTEERELVQTVFSLDKNPVKHGFSLLDLKKFCLSQIPVEISQIISLNYQETVRESRDFFGKTGLKALKNVKINQKTQKIDSFFKPFCRLFVKYPEFQRNEGVSQENWLESFRKLVQKIYLKPEAKDFSFYLQLLNEENLKEFNKQIQIFEKNQEFQKNPTLLLLLRMYKILVSLYFCENPFILRNKNSQNHQEIIGKFVLNVEKRIKTVNFARKILRIPEKMRIILDYSALDTKNLGRSPGKSEISNELFEKIIGFLDIKQRFSLRILSKAKKIFIETQLIASFSKKLEVMDQDFQKVLLFLSNFRVFLPKTKLEFDSLKKIEIFRYFFPRFDDFEDFSNIFQSVHKRNPFLCLKDKDLKIFNGKRLTKTATNFDFLIKLLKIAYFGCKFQRNAEVFQLINLIPFEKLPQKSDFTLESAKTLIISLENHFFPNKILESPSKKAENNKILCKSSQRFLILTTKIVRFLSNKDLVSWGLCSKLCAMQVLKILETRSKNLRKALKTNEISSESEIKALKMLRKIRKTEENHCNISKTLENIDRLCELDKENLRFLKSLNTFPKKYEVFLRPFTLVFPSKGEKFRSFQTFLKRKDLFYLINRLNIELISSENMHLIEKYLYEYREFFDNNIKKDKLYEKLYFWLVSLVDFYCKIRKFHLTYGETLDMRFPESHREKYCFLDSLTEQFFVVSKIQDNFSSILEETTDFPFENQEKIFN